MGKKIIFSREDATEGRQSLQYIQQHQRYAHLRAKETADRWITCLELRQLVLLGETNLFYLKLKTKIQEDNELCDLHVPASEVLCKSFSPARG